jgi:cytidylate kinase
MAVITISRQHGSRGAAIGAQVAERLGWRYVDDDLIFLVAQRAGLGDEVVRPYDQEGFSRLRAFVCDCLDALESLGPPPFGETVGAPNQIKLPVDWTRFFSARYLDLAKQMIRALAARGRVVIMGRGAQVVLRDAPQALHIRVVAPLPMRIRRVAQGEGVSDREAARRIRRRDRAVARYLRHFHGVDWTDPLLYHLTLNMGALAEEEAVRLILQAAPGGGEPPHQGTRPVIGTDSLGEAGGFFRAAEYHAAAVPSRRPASEAHERIGARRHSFARPVPLAPPSRGAPVLQAEEDR